MTQEQLIQQIKIKKTFLCIGLDVDLDKIPEFLLKEEDPIFAFNKAIAPDRVILLKSLFMALADFADE